MGYCYLSYICEIQVQYSQQSVTPGNDQESDRERTDSGSLLLALFGAFHGMLSDLEGLEWLHVKKKWSNFLL